MKKKYVKPQAIEVPVAVECLADFATSNGVKASQPSDKSSWNKASDDPDFVIASPKNPHQIV